MNRHILQVFGYELKRNLRRRGFLFTSFGLPLIAIILVLGIRFISERNAQNAANNPQSDNPPAAERDERIERAGYVDLTGEFTDPGDLSDRLTPYADEAAARAALDAGEIDVYYLIPVNYLETCDAGDAAFLVNASRFELDRGVGSQSSRLRCRSEFVPAIGEPGFGVARGEFTA
jgi:ABC-type Na+ efflux pump permease subunit